MAYHNRHHFRIACAGLRTLLIVCACFSLFACKKQASIRYGMALGTICTINAFSDASDRLYDELFALIADIDATFSATNPDSELLQVNTAAGTAPVPVSKAFFFVLSEAVRYAALTDGAFNPAAGALVQLWGISTEREHVPDKAAIEKASQLCDWHDIVLQENQSGEGGTVFLQKKGMSLDLGGIVKGYAADEIVAHLQERKVKQAVISLGGNVYVYGERKDGSDWQVGIKDPFAPEKNAAMLSVKEMSVVTSGDYERYFEAGGIRYHHILDTKTGFPARTGVHSVTICSRSSMQADALSTAFFVTGKEKALALLAQMSGIHAVFIEDNGIITATPGLAISY